MKTYEELFDEFAIEMASSELDFIESNKAIFEFEEQINLFFDEEFA